MRLSNKLISAIAVERAMNDWLDTHTKAENWSKIMKEWLDQAIYIHELCEAENVFGIPNDEFEEFLAINEDTDKFKAYVAKYGYAA